MTTTRADSATIEVAERKGPSGGSTATIEFDGRRFRIASLANGEVHFVVERESLSAYMLVGGRETKVLLRPEERS